MKKMPMDNTVIAEKNIDRILPLHKVCLRMKAPKTLC